MCGANEHDFAVVDIDDEITEDGGTTYFRPATIFCRKCGYYTHIKACHHSGKAGRGMRATMDVVDDYSGLRNSEARAKAVREAKLDEVEEEYFDPVERVFKYERHRMV